MNRNKYRRIEEYKKQLLGSTFYEHTNESNQQQQNTTFETKYSEIDQVKFVKDSL